MGANNIFRAIKPKIPYCLGTTKKAIGHKIDQWNEENPTKKINGAMTLLAQEIYVKFCQAYNNGLFTGKFLFSTNNIELASWIRMSPRTIQRHINRFLEAGILVGKTPSKNSFSNYGLHLDKNLFVLNRTHETAWNGITISNSIESSSPLSEPIHIEQPEKEFETIEFSLDDLDKVLEGVANYATEKRNSQHKPVENKVNKSSYEFSNSLEEFIEKNTKPTQKAYKKPKNESFSKNRENPLNSIFFTHEDKMSPISSCQELQELQEPLKEHVDKLITPKKQNLGEKDKNIKNKQSGRTQQINSLKTVFDGMYSKKEKSCAKKEKKP